MKKATTIVVTLAVIVIAAVVFIKPSSQDAGKEAVTASLEATETFFDFGEIKMSDGDVENKYTLTNTGTEPVTIGKVYTSCMCTTVSIIESDGNKKGKFGMQGHKGQLLLADTTVQPGESIEVIAVYDPAAHGPSGVGLAQRSVYLETDSKSTPKVELRLKAMVTS